MAPPAVKNSGGRSSGLAVFSHETKDREIAWLTWNPGDSYICGGRKGVGLREAAAPGLEELYERALPTIPSPPLCPTSSALTTAADVAGWGMRLPGTPTAERCDAGREPGPGFGAGAGIE